MHYFSGYLHSFLFSFFFFFFLLFVWCIFFILLLLIFLVLLFYIWGPHINTIQLNFALIQPQNFFANNNLLHLYFMWLIKCMKFLLPSYLCFLFALLFSMLFYSPFFRINIISVPFSFLLDIIQVISVLFESKVNHQYLSFE